MYRIAFFISGSVRSANPPRAGIPPWPLIALAVTAAFYVPGLMIYGPSSWFEFGPFSVQHGRIMLYASYFFFGAGIGVALIDSGIAAYELQRQEGAGPWTTVALATPRRMAMHWTCASCSPTTPSVPSACP